MATVNPNKHLTNLDEWRRMQQANIFPPGCRVELINGEIFDVAQPSCNQAGHVRRINQVFSKFISHDLIISTRNPVQLGDFSEPEPDFILLKPNDDFYSSRHPSADDVLLLIEVADTSLKFDQNQKLHLYALHNIPEYWLLNLNDSCLEVYRKPNGDVYAEKTTLHIGDTITLSQLPEITVRIADIL